MNLHPVLERHGSFAEMKLGRKPRRVDARTLSIGTYLDKALLPPIPATYTAITDVAEWPMYGNDRLGDCTCAAAGHMVEAWSFAAGTGRVPLDPDVEEFYWLTGDPSSTTGTAGGATDDGRDELSVLNAWRTIGIGGDKIDAYVSVDPRDHATVQAAIYLFGGVYTGISLPLSAQGQSVWDVVGDGKGSQDEPGSWGGHAVPYEAYDESGVSVITWGAPLAATWRFNDEYTDEMYAIVSTDWLTAAGESPMGFDLAQLQADLREVTA